MNIWTFDDFLFAIIMAVFALATHFFAQWSEEWVEGDDDMSKKEGKICRFSILIIRILSYIAIVISVGTLALPLLDTLLTALLGTVIDFFSRFGGLIIVVALIFFWLKNRQDEKRVNENTITPTEIEIMYAEQEAAELHEDLGELTFNVVLDASENTPLKRPRDTASIETNREKPYSMDGEMAVHQYSVDIDTPLDKAGEDLVVRELQRHTNQRAKRYPQLCRDGHAPIIYDLKNNGNFVIVEVVLYSEKYKDKIEARRKARIARQQKVANTDDKDF